MKHAYLAGYTDGDGCIFARTYIQKPKNITVYEGSLQISSTCEEVLHYFSEEFKGTVRKRPEKRSNRKDSWVWAIKGTFCFKILEKIEPFLLLKKKSSYFCRSLIKNISTSRTFVGKSVSLPDHENRNYFINQIKKEIHMDHFVSEENFQSLKGLEKSIEPTRAELAYIAGLIDAEGCFRIKNWQPKRKGRNRSYVISLEIGNTKFPIFPWLIERFGGSVIYRRPTTSRRNPMIIWSISSNSLYQFCKNVCPFLRVKKERCEKLMEFYQLNFENGGDRFSKEFQSDNAHLHEKREFLFQEFKLLNSRGRH